MKRNLALKILNPILGVLVLNQILTGVFADDLPPKAFELLHANGGILVAAAALLHVTLNWSWVKMTYFRSHSVGQPQIARK